MDDRTLKRAFAAAAYGSFAEDERPCKHHASKGGSAGSGPAADAEKEKEPQSVVDQILEAWSKKEYFKLLGLPDPTADELGRPIWPCTAADVSRSYRRLSVLVHPDKVPGQAARDAFEALNQAHRMLKDPGEREAALRAIAGRLKKEREAADAAAEFADRVKQHGARNSSIRALRKQEGDTFSAEVVGQMQRRLAEAKLRAELSRKGAEISRAREEGGPSSGDESPGHRAGSAADKRRQPPSMNAQTELSGKHGSTFDSIQRNSTVVQQHRPVSALASSGEHRATQAPSAVVGPGKPLAGTVKPAAAAAPGKRLVTSARRGGSPETAYSSSTDSDEAVKSKPMAATGRGGAGGARKKKASFI